MYCIELKKQNTVYQTAVVWELDYDEYPTPSPEEPAAMIFPFHLQKWKITIFSHGDERKKNG